MLPKTKESFVLLFGFWKQERIQSNIFNRQKRHLKHKDIKSIIRRSRRGRRRREGGGSNAFELFNNLNIWSIFHKAFFDSLVSDDTLKLIH